MDDPGVADFCNIIDDVLKNLLTVIEGFGTNPINCLEIIIEGLNKLLSLKRFTFFCLKFFSILISLLKQFFVFQSPHEKTFLV